MQKYVLRLSKTLKPLSEKQRQWAVDNVIPKYAAISRNRIYCLECNHKFDHLTTPLLQASLSLLTCPDCSCSLASVKWGRENGDHYHFAVITTRKIFQVVRVFFISKYCYLKKKPRYDINEVGQFFIHPSGEMFPITRLTNSFFSGNSIWSTGSQLELRGDSPAQDNRNFVNPDEIYPRIKIIPEIKRNGFTGNVHDIPPQLLFSKLLSCSKTETLLKANAFSLLKHSINSPGDINHFWKSIKISIRHNYSIDEADTWIDYLTMLNFLNLDILNPKFICPANAKDAHDKAVKKSNALKKKIALDKQKAQMLESQQRYFEEKSKYFDLCFAKDNIVIEPIKDVQDFLLIGDLHDHCLFSAKYHEKENSLLLSAKIDNTPIETIEVNLSSFKITQSRGHKNLPTKFSPKLKAIVSKNMNKIISCSKS